MSISLTDLPLEYQQQAIRKYNEQKKVPNKKTAPSPKVKRGKGKSPKLHNKKEEVNGIVFDSKREAKRYKQLLILMQSGEIWDLEIQKKYELIPAQYETFERYGKKGNRLKDGQKLLERAVCYYADFVYQCKDGLVVEDSKGYRDPNSATYAKFVLKRKLMLFRYGIKVKEV